MRDLCCWNSVWEGVLIETDISDTTATADLTKQTQCQEMGAFSPCRVSGAVRKFPHKNFQIKYKRVILKERKMALAPMTLWGLLPNTRGGNDLTNRKKKKNSTLK